MWKIERVASHLLMLSLSRSQLYDLNERHLSTDQWVKGDCCQSKSDPATCFLGDPEHIFKYDPEAVQD